MICRCFGRSLDLSELGRQAARTGRLMVGVPDYDTYVAHVTANHPDRTPMDREQFFRMRQSARYGASGGLRCC